MSLPSAMTDINLMEGELSFYEDALDDSDEELQKLHHATAIQLEKVERQSRRRQIVPIVTNAPNISSTIHPPQSSSSEHSSIERLNGEPVRSRRSTGMHKKRSHKSGTSSASNGGGGTPDEWKLVNYAFQEAASYPILFQLNQQLQTISVQLNELSCANALQLKTTYRLLRETIKMNKQQQNSIWKSSWLKAILLWLPIMCSPFFIKIMYQLYRNRKIHFGRTFLKYM